MTTLKESAGVVASAAAGMTGREAGFGGFLAVAGVIVTDYLGGWDKALQVLFILMVADYVTGVLKAIKTKNLNSDNMFWGGIRKITVLFVVGLAALLDSWLQPDTPLFRTAAIYFYVGREGLSVVENLGVMGVPMPGWMAGFLEQMKQRGEAKGGK